MQRLAQVMARSREKAGLGEIRQLELVRALLDLAFQRSVGSFQLLRHAVELLTQRLQLVARSNGDALAEIAPPDPRRTTLEGLDGNDHAPREHQSRETGKPQRNSKQCTSAYNRGIDWCVSLRDRQLDNHEPAQRRDHLMHGEDPFPLYAFERLLRGVQPRGRGKRCPNLGNVREVRIAQDQTDVGVGNEPTLPVDDINLASLADLDL